MEDRVWFLPNMDDILEPAPMPSIDQAEDERLGKAVVDRLAGSDILARVCDVNCGPLMTEVVLGPGKTRRKRGPKFHADKIQRLSNDIALALGTGTVSVEPAKRDPMRVSVWVPNRERATVSLRCVLESGAFEQSRNLLKIGLGKDARGCPVIVSLCAMPHVLIAGTVRSGKSTCIHAIIVSLLLQHSPDALQFVFVDVAKLGTELGFYDGIPHLVTPVITEVSQALEALTSLREEVDSRYCRFRDAGMHHIDAFNRHSAESGGGFMPHMVMIIDEVFDLAARSRKALEAELGRLAEVGHQAGLHLIVSTSRPSAKVLEASIKGNFPTRIAFRVTTLRESIIILDADGAQRLLGDGDMYFLSANSQDLARVQGTFVSDCEIERIAAYWRGAAPVPPGRA